MADQHQEDADAWLMGGGKTPSISWRNKPIGHAVTGIIDRPSKKQQQRDVETGDLKYWGNGDPMWQLVVFLKTGEFDADTPEHDGVWALYVKGKSLTDAVREAVRKSGATALAVGGKLTVTLVGEGKATNKAFNPPKLYSATYIAPPDGASEAYLKAGAYLTGGEPCPPGIEPARWAALDSAGKARLRAALGEAPLDDEPPF